MKTLRAIMLFAVFALQLSYAFPSFIIKSEGIACMKEGETQKQTEELALQNAKKEAVTKILSNIKTQTHDPQLMKDLLSAYTNGEVKVIKQEGIWGGEPKVGSCYILVIRAEVVPNEEQMKNINTNLLDTLQVKVWTNKTEYSEGERIKIYLKGNKPFYATVLYRNAKGELFQLLPNPYRKNNYFSRNAVYEIPSAEDKFELTVGPPFGEESIVVYASTSMLGELDVEKAEGLYLIKTSHEYIGVKVRDTRYGLQENVVKCVHGWLFCYRPVEFFEAKVTLKTRRQGE